MTTCLQHTMTCLRLAVGVLPAVTLFGLHCGAARALWSEGVLTIVAEDTAANDQFGAAVGIDGDAAIIGAPLHDQNGSNAGTSYILTAVDGTWAVRQELLPSDGAAGDKFGFAVAISGDAAVVGAYQDDDRGLDSGSTYVFRRQGSVWLQEQKLLASDGTAGDAYGRAVAAWGNRVVIGAPSADGAVSGRAYVYRFTGVSWVEEARIFPPAGGANFFGQAVALGGDTLAIGNSLSGEGGAVFVYRRLGTFWFHEQTLVADDAAGGDLFGISVAVSGDRLAIGAYADDDNGLQSGSAYVFRRTSTAWIQEAKLTASDGDHTDHFGNAIAISGDLVVVGASEHDGGEFQLYNTGAAYVYRRYGSTWLEEAELEAPGGWQMDFFGSSVGVSGNVVVAGASEDDNGFLNSGSATIFPNGAAVCPPDLNGNGTVDFADLIELLGGWGPCAGCPSDFDQDGDIDFADLLAFFGSWGDCG